MKKNIFQIGVLLFTTAFVLFFFTPSAEAVSALPPYFRPINLPEITGVPKAEAQAQRLIGKVINWVFGIVGLISVWAVLNSGFWLVVAMGRGEAIDQRKKSLFWAIGGLVLLILSYIIIRFVIEFVVGVAEEPTPTEGTSPSPGSQAAPP